VRAARCAFLREDATGQHVSCLCAGRRSSRQITKNRRRILTGVASASSAQVSRREQRDFACPYDVSRYSFRDRCLLVFDAGLVIQPRRDVKAPSTDRPLVLR
jgi:hypothetical protein